EPWIASIKSTRRPLSTCLMRRDFFSSGMLHLPSIVVVFIQVSDHHAKDFDKLLARLARREYRTGTAVPVVRLAHVPITPLVKKRFVPPHFSSPCATPYDTDGTRQYTSLSRRLPPPMSSCASSRHPRAC